MGKNIKVKINTTAWGDQVMAGPEMRAYLQQLGGQVASKLPGSSVEISSSRTLRGGGRRARAIVTTTIPLSDEAENGNALAALQSVVPSGHAPKRTRAYKVREKKRQERRA